MFAMRAFAIILLCSVCSGAKVEVYSSIREAIPGGAFVNGGTALPNGALAPDLFLSAAVQLGNSPPMSKHAFMEEIESIEEKLRTNVTLCHDEIKTWKGVQSEMQNSLGTDYCTQFQNPAGVDAVCCYVQASGTNYGLCSFLSIVNANVAVTASTPLCPADSAFGGGSDSSNNSDPLAPGSIRQVINVDLRGEICENVDELNLCYVYVSEYQSITRFA